jgi:predicted RNase H-like HicB family nuclease
MSAHADKSEAAGESLHSYKIFWSKEDGEFVAECREIPGLSGLGISKVEAIKELKIAMGVWLGHLEASGSPVPAPRLISRSHTRPAAAMKRASR